MAKQTEIKAEEKIQEPVFGKSQLRQIFNSDIVGAVFADGEKVTRKQAETKIKNFLNKEVH